MSFEAITAISAAEEKARQMKAEALAAAKAAEAAAVEEGKLTMEIRAEARPPYVVLTIRDEGVGMSREELAHCLDPYFTTKSTGTGLGLTLSRDLVNRNGGELTIESQVMDHTTITMKFLETTP